VGDGDVVRWSLVASDTELFRAWRAGDRNAGSLLGVPEDTARSRLRKAKQLLEAALRRLEADAVQLESTLSNLGQWATGLRARLGPPQPAGT